MEDGIGRLAWAHPAPRWPLRRTYQIALGVENLECLNARLETDHLTVKFTGAPCPPIHVHQVTAAHPISRQWGLLPPKNRKRDTNRIRKILKCPTHTFLSRSGHKYLLERP